MSNRSPGDTPILITDAQRSYEEELATRKRRYGIMMGMRVPCLLLAALFYNHPLVAAGLILMSIPLPWMAVLIANDRLPRKTTKFRRYRDSEATPSMLSLESGEHRVITPSPDSDERRVEHRIIESPDGR